MHERQHAYQSLVGPMIFGVCLLLTTSIAAQEVEADGPRVRLKAGASLADAVGALARATAGVVVADAAVVDQRLADDLVDVPLLEALNEISVGFDCHWVKRGRAIALQLRRADPNEPRRLEIEEIRRTAVDLEAMFSRVSPPMAAPDLSRGRARFVLSLTAEQQGEMLQGGMPVHLLSPRQQRQLIALNLAWSYGRPALQLQRTRQLIENLDRAVSVPRFAEQDILQTRDPTAGRSLSFRFRAPGVAQEIELGINFVGDLQAARYEPPTARPSGESIEADARRDAPGWEQPVRQMTLSQFSSAWRRAIGSSLRVPAYAAERRFWIASSGASRAEAAQALADLWGWELSSTSSGRRLGRAAVQSPKSLVEAHAQWRAAVPPEIRHCMRNFKDSREHPSRRLEDLRPLYYEAVEKVGLHGRWPLANVDPELKRRIAFSLLAMQVNSAFSSSGSDRQSPPAYLAEPEKIVLTLSGPIDDDDPPMLMMHARDGERSLGGLGWQAYAEWPPRRRQ